MVYMGGPDGVWGLDAQSGAVEWHYFTVAMVGSSPAVLTGAQNGSTLYVGCEDGYLYALRIPDERRLPSASRPARVVALAGPRTN